MADSSKLTARNWQCELMVDVSWLKGWEAGRLGSWKALWGLLL